MPGRWPAAVTAGATPAWPNEAMTKRPGTPGPAWRPAGQPGPRRARRTEDTRTAFQEAIAARLGAALLAPLPRLAPGSPTGIWLITGNDGQPELTEVPVPGRLRHEHPDPRDLLREFSVTAARQAAAGQGPFPGVDIHGAAYSYEIPLGGNEPPIRGMAAVDRHGVTYIITETEEDTKTQCLAFAPGEGPTGPVFDALDRVLTAAAGIQLPLRGGVPEPGL